MRDDFWDAYTWFEAPYGTFKTLEMTVEVDGKTKKIKKDSYPYDFSIRIDSPAKSVKISFNGILSDEKPFKTKTFELERALPSSN